MPRVPRRRLAIAPLRGVARAGRLPRRVHRRPPVGSRARGARDRASSNSPTRVRGRATSRGSPAVSTSSPTANRLPSRTTWNRSTASAGRELPSRSVRAHRRMSGSGFDRAEPVVGRSDCASSPQRRPSLALHAARLERVGGGSCRRSRSAPTSGCSCTAQSTPSHGSRRSARSVAARRGRPFQRRPCVFCEFDVAAGEGQSSGIERRSPTGRSVSGKASEPARTHHSITS